MLEKILNPRDFRRLLYIVGIIFEFIGFWLLFNFDKAIEIISEYKIVFALILISGGYLLAVKQRR